MRIYNAVVKMGNDGTDDDVKIGVCNSVNEVCCENKISSILDDWVKNKEETWSKRKFDECAKKLYKVKGNWYSVRVLKYFFLILLPIPFTRR